MVAQNTARVRKRIHAIFQRSIQHIDTVNLNPAPHGKTLNLPTPCRLCYSQNRIGAEGWNDFWRKARIRTQSRMICEIICRPFCRYDRVNIGLLDQRPRTVAAPADHFLRLHPDFLRRLRCKRRCNMKISLQLQMRPVIQRIPDHVRHRLRKSQKFLFVRCRSRNERLRNSIGAHLPPFVMVILQP